jgi:hypothetical protein
MPPKNTAPAPADTTAAAPTLTLTLTENPTCNPPGGGSWRWDAVAAAWVEATPDTATATEQPA